jgi:hypothetical protein
MLKDINPYDLPLSAFSGGNNVRFDQGKVMRAPVFRAIVDGTAQADPQFVYGVRPAQGYDFVLIGGADGTISRYSSGAETDVTRASHTPNVVNTPWTGAFHGEGTYLNRVDMVPQYLGPTDTQFADLPNWTATWRTKVLRVYGDFLVAINVQKGAVAFPNMVKWSDLTLAGVPPGSWDETDLATSAGENILNSLDSPLLDGVTLRDSLILYAETQVWRMTFVPNSPFIFDFRLLFDDGGALNTNCVVEVDGRHYVFGNNDIYVHDGTTKRSIADGRVRDFVYRNINASRGEQCFAAHNPGLNEITFAFVSADEDTYWKAPTRCNRGVVYNYINDTWSIVDLPNVGAMSAANVENVTTYAQVPVTTTHELIGGTYADLSDGFKTHVISVSSPLASEGLSQGKLHGIDLADKGNLTFPFDVETASPAWAERIGVDLDVSTRAELRQYKVCSRLYPQVTVFRSIPTQIEVGGALTATGPITWLPKQGFDPASDYKVDVRAGGRYLAFRFSVDAISDFELSGYDLELKSGGSR